MIEADAIPNQHISYAMRNAQATDSLVYLNSPVNLMDWTHLAIELLITAGFVLAVRHAWTQWQSNENPAAIRTLVVCLLYGLVMDITSYYTVENFWHGEFTVMLLYNRLPLYIVFFYPAFLYHVYMTVRRFDLDPLTEAISVGFVSGLLYQVFDNFGPMVGWWIWQTDDPTTWPYLNSVPVTSYHWMFLFSGVLGWVVRRFCWDGPASGHADGRTRLAIGLSPVAIILVGTLLFIPYNLFAYNGMLGAAAALHALSFSAAGLWFLLGIGKVSEPRDTSLMLFPLVYLVGHLLLYVAKVDLFFNIDPDGLAVNGLAVGNPFAAMAGIIAGIAIVLAAHPAGPTINRAGTA